MTFMAYMNVSRANASIITETIFKSLEHYLQLTKEGILRCLVEFGSDDGAAVMTGSKSGVNSTAKKEATSPVHSSLYGTPAGVRL